MTEYEPEPTKVLRREPTAWMLRAGKYAEWDDDTTNEVVALLIWRAMWDAAQDEGLGPI